MNSNALVVTPPAAPDFFLAARSSQDEVMDDVRVDERDYRQCLADLAAVNRVTRTHAPIVEWVSAQVKRLPRRKLVVLDVAFGQGDLLRELAAWAREHEVELELHGVDLNPRSAVNARAATPAELDITFHTADVFAFSPVVQPDLIVSSQFTHHLEERDVVRFLRWLERTAKHAWFIADLERNAFAFHGFPLLCAVAGGTPSSSAMGRCRLRARSVVRSGVCWSRTRE
ncbi:MAG: methyltransferase domain-containing protein [Archangium sp.]